MTVHTQLAVVVGADRSAPVEAVRYDPPDPDRADDSGFLIFLVGAPHDPREVDPERETRTVCVHCLLEQWPEAGRGLDLARRHGVVMRDLETDEWEAV